MILGMKAALRQQMELQEEQMHRSEPQLPPAFEQQQHVHYHHHQAPQHHHHLNNPNSQQHHQHQHHSPHRPLNDPVPPLMMITTNQTLMSASGVGSLVDEHHQHHQHHQGSATNNKRIRLKCVVLGAAGAGKTSILRRYFSGTFQSLPGNRKPTLGADFYSARVNNPIYRQLHHNQRHQQQQQQQHDDYEHEHHKRNGNEDDHNSSHHDHQHTRHQQHTRRPSQEEEKHDEEYNDDDKKKESSSSTNTTTTATTTTATTTTTTATTTNTTFWMKDIQTQPTVLIQVWDTAGKERYAEKHGHKMKYTANLGDSFFRNVHAAMLVYDVTSSTSFTQLLKWHADLTARFQVITNTTTNNNNNNNHNHSKQQQQPSSATSSTLPFPVIVVGNKMDVLTRDQNVPPKRSIAPKQRDVMGLKRQFRGNDSRYEYRVSLPPTHSTTTSTTAASHTKHHYPHHRYLESSTYMATGETWTSDGSYLHSLLTTEDGSHPDREMVLLWCMRNGLKHFEVSALEGTGIDHAMEELVTQALETRNQQELAEANAKAATVALKTPPIAFLYQNDDDDDDYDVSENEMWGRQKSPFPPRIQRNPSLDLQARYAPDDDQCCRPFGNFAPWLWWSRRNLKA